jgi:hypothetical protein
VASCCSCCSQTPVRAPPLKHAPQVHSRQRPRMVQGWVALAPGENLLATCSTMPTLQRQAGRHTNQVCGSAWQGGGWCRLPRAREIEWRRGGVWQGELYT